jgi:hypothetical protein
MGANLKAIAVQGHGKVPVVTWRTRGALEANRLCQVTR